MRIETFGRLRARLVGGSDREGGGDGPVVIAMHGFGAPGDDLVSLWRVVRAPRGTRWVFPEAPLELGAGYGAGRAWWKIDLLRYEKALASGSFDALMNDAPAGLDSAREAVNELVLDVERRLGAARSRIVIGGFSQGAMLACDVALRAQTPFAALFMWSGSAIAMNEWRPRMKARPGRVFLSHGTQDPLLPFVVTEHLFETFKNAGWQAELVQFHDGHTIAPEAVDRTGQFLESVLP